MARFQILSLDGGGIRGVFSAALLANFEKRYSTRVIEHFDLIVGTSTGGIIALGLGLGLSAQQILEIYTENADDIFPTWLSGRAKKIPYSKLIEPRSYTSLFRRKFSNKPLELALRVALGNQRLLGHSTKRLVITSYDLQRRSVKLFKTPHHQRFRSDYLIPAWKVALATSAAPTFFRATEANARYFVDGGLWSNNPIMVGVTEAIGVLEQAPSDIHVLSLGTLDEISSLRKTTLWGGKFFWIKPSINSMMAGQSTAASGQASLILSNSNILRINPPVPSGFCNLDDVSRIDELIGIANGEAEHQSPHFEKQFLDHIAPDFTPEYEVKT